MYKLVELMLSSLMQTEQPISVKMLMVLPHSLWVITPLAYGGRRQDVGLGAVFVKVANQFIIDDIVLSCILSIVGMKEATNFFRAAGQMAQGTHCFGFHVRKAENAGSPTR